MGGFFSNIGKNLGDPIGNFAGEIAGGITDNTIGSEQTSSGLGNLLNEGLSGLTKSKTSRKNKTNNTKKSGSQGAIIQYGILGLGVILIGYFMWKKLSKRRK